MESSQKALLIGSSGLIGSHCLQFLLSDPNFSEVEIWVRRSLNIDHPKLIERIVDFSKPESFVPIKASTVFCCLGTTIDKAGNKDAFREVDYWHVLRVAKAAKQNGANMFLFVSSIGANSKSANFYLRTKGEIEDSLIELNFSALHIFRPSILLGKRNEFRLGESIGKAIMQSIGFLLIGKARKYRGVEASQVAKVMIAASKKDLQGTTFWESDSIQTYK